MTPTVGYDESAHPSTPPPATPKPSDQPESQEKQKVTKLSTSACLCCLPVSDLMVTSQQNEDTSESAAHSQISEAAKDSQTSDWLWGADLTMTLPSPPRELPRYR